MKRITWLVTVAALVVGCSGLAAAQCAGHLNPGGYDLIQTFNGSSDNLSGMGLGFVTFSGVPLPGGVAGNADTIVCRLDPLPDPIGSGATLKVQIVALYLKGDTTYGENGQAVTVYATINQTNGKISKTQLPQPDPLPPPSTGTGTMTVHDDGTFDTHDLWIQADLIVVPRGMPVTYPFPLFHGPMPGDTLSASGSTWTTTPPSGYPTSMTFPSGGFYINQPGGGGFAAAALVTSRVVRVSLIGLGLVFACVALVKIRSGVNSGRLNFRTVYLLGLAAIAWFLAWRSSKLTFPTIAHAAAVTTCAPHTVSAWVQEGGGTVVHVFVSAVCATTDSSTTSTTTSASLP
jgi:hypothetical protein